MRYLDVRRISYTSFETLSIWTIPGTAFLGFGIERPWESNAPFVSCIPKGAYLMKRGDFKGKYPNFEIQDVPGRTAIEIHKANKASDLQGCLAAGARIGALSGEVAVLDSSNTHLEFMAYFAGDNDAIITIHDD